MLSALSAHLKSTGAYGSITLLRLTGVNRTTEELRLPAETAASTGLACVSNSIATWQAAGYRPSLLLQGWNAVIGSFNKYFPDKSFSVAIIPNDAFPGIDQSGNAIVGTIGDENAASLAIRQPASSRPPGGAIRLLDAWRAAFRCGHQCSSELRNTGGLADQRIPGHPRRGMLGAHHNLDSLHLGSLPSTAGDGRLPPGQANPLRAQYIEVFNANANANALQQDILTAHFQLLPPAVTFVANAEGGVPAIAPNAWVEVLGSGLSLTGDSRAWKAADFVNSQLPVQLDNVSVTVNGKAAFVYYLSPSQINILTPPDPITGTVKVVVTNNGTQAGAFNAQAQSISPSFFVFNGGPYVAATHANGSLLGPPGFVSRIHHSSEAWRNGCDLRQRFWPHLDARGQRIRTPVGKFIAVTGDPHRRPPARVQFAGLISPGLFQFNVTIPTGVIDGDQPITAAYQEK